MAGCFFIVVDVCLINDNLEEEGLKWLIVINELLVCELGYVILEVVLDDWIVLGINDVEGEIVGVIKDFYNKFLYD